MRSTSGRSKATRTATCSGFCSRRNLPGFVRTLVRCLRPYPISPVSQVVEAPLPSPYEWAIRSNPAMGDMSFLGLAKRFDAATFTLDHPHLSALRRSANGLRDRMMMGGVSDYPGQDLYASPHGEFAESFGGGEQPGTWAVSPSGPRGGGDEEEMLQAVMRASLADSQAASAAVPTRSDAGRSDLDSEMAAALAASLQDMGGGAPAGAAAAAAAAAAAQEAAEETLDAADVFRLCLSGAVAEVRRFLRHGGHVDTVYKSAYGWDVGPDWLFTRPSEGMTPLNYVATWTDVIGPAAVDLVSLLLEHGADLQRDDGQEEWFTPLHNAVEHGAAEVVQVMLDRQPAVANITTGDGRTPLHVLATCEDADGRMATLSTLLRAKADLSFAEPFGGNTPLHAFAKEGCCDVVEKLLQADAPTSTFNEAQRTPRQEAEHALMLLDAQAISRTISPAISSAIRPALPRSPCSSPRERALPPPLRARRVRAARREIGSSSRSRSSRRTREAISRRSRGGLEAVSLVSPTLRGVRVRRRRRNWEHVGPEGRGSVMQARLGWAGVLM